MKQHKEAFIRAAADDLRRQREALGLSLADVGEGIGVSASAVCTWEKGTAAMSAYAEMLLRLYFKRKWHEREQQVQRERERTSGAGAAI